MFKKSFLPILALFVVFLSSNKAEAFDFDQCMSRARQLGDIEMIKCKQTQIPIDLNALKQKYNNIAKDPRFKESITPTDLKKMYNAWQTYRDIYCKTFSEAYRKNAIEEGSTQVDINNSAEYYYEHCLQEFTVNAKDYMTALEGAVVPEGHVGD